MSSLFIQGQSFSSVIINRIGSNFINGTTTCIIKELISLYTSAKDGNGKYIELSIKKSYFLWNIKYYVKFIPKENFNFF